MWLPRTERNLLISYYRNVPTLDRPRTFRLSELVRALRDPGAELGEYGEDRDQCATPPNHASLRAAVTAEVRGRDDVNKANHLLEKRGLIRVVSHPGDPNAVALNLTLAGYELGRKYASLWWSTGLYYAELKHHWIVPAIAFGCGILGTLLAQWLGKVVIA
ncbi:MAG: hypothetical protein AB1716_08515 [Planctomycetota bacterium]